LTYAGNGINIPTGPSDLGLAKEFVRFAMSREAQIAFTEAELAVSARSDIPQESLDKAGFHNAQMLSALPEIGASVGWDDPIPAELAQRAHVLYGEMLTGAIAPSDVGEQLQRVLDRLRR
jgi:ABC-type glycerol-3-phosphate transport system substrate-binding protein